MSEQRPPSSDSLRASLPPIARVMVGDHVIDALRTALLRGDFAPAERLVEAVLAKELRVSRAPVREAMMQLEREGLLVFDERGAAWVREFTIADFDEIFSLRLALEPMAARLAAERMDKAVLQALEENVASAEQAATADELWRLDSAFHEMIVQQSGHRRLARYWTGLGQQVLMMLAQMDNKGLASSQLGAKETADEHYKLLELLRSGNSRGAEPEMQRHIVTWRGRLLQIQPTERQRGPLGQ